ncbi:alpha/beta hydrolase [Glaciihabitans sp. UYNi722]|uniref:alpha/beta fold hydrolase n=1 Tax=Glaciihabitans sp. UYNi722 TaxID=3156344 RepID=UPI003390F9A8
MQSRNLGYSEYGADRQETLFLLHGGGVTGLMWRTQVAALTDFHLVVVDLPGHASSSHLEFLSLDDAADRVAELIDAVAHGGRTHVIGLSLGGDIGVRMLARHPGVVRSAMLTGLAAEPISPLMQAIGRLGGLSMKSRAYARMSARTIEVPPELLEEYLAQSRNFRRSDYQRFTREIFAGVSLDGLSTMDVPVLVVAGERESPTARRSAAIVAAAIPGAVAALAPGVGHVWNVENPELFNETVTMWVNDHHISPELIRL